MNKILMVSFFLIFNQMVNCQNSNQFLVGEWRLSSLITKRISDSEKQKRYVFTLDSLSLNKNETFKTGIYNYDENSNVIEWILNNSKESVFFNIQKIDDNELCLEEQSNPGIFGVLNRVSEIGKVHYQKGLLAEKEQQFEVAFYEFEKAAKLENSTAMYKFGLCYFSGSGVVKDEELGFYWIQKAAIYGDSNAQVFMQLINREY